ncbi:MAG: glutathione S-transferase [Psychrobium sp.]|nr:glutathione S-transferase [Psychrobium sp.]
MKLVVGTSSTWSMRAWLCLKLADVDFEEFVIDLAADSYTEQLQQHSASKLVPVLQLAKLQIHDSLAIAEYVNELADYPLYPNDVNQRAIARSLAAELHSGFSTLRNECPFSLDKVIPVVMSPAIANEVARLECIWSQARGEFYFEQAGIVDAFYSVLAYRLATYGITLEGHAGQYQQSLLQWPLFKQAIAHWQKLSNG